MIVIHISVHHLYHAFQWLIALSKQVFLYHTAVVKRIYLVALLYPSQCLFLAAQFSQCSSLQGSSLMVMAVADKRALQLVECILPSLIGHTDASCLKISGISPCLVPCRLPEASVGSLNSAKILVSQTKVENCLAIVWIWVALLQHLYCCFQIILGFLETGAAQIPQSHLHVASIVHRIAAQSLLVVVKCTPCGMAILLKMQTSKIQLVNGLCILWRQCSLGSIRYSTNLVGLRIPCQQWEVSFVLCTVNNQSQFVKSLFHLYCFYQHLLWR